MAILLPHHFKDGVGEVASGVQVMENFEALVAAIEALEVAPGAYVARAPLSPETLTGSGSTEWTNSSARSAVAHYDFELQAGGGGFAGILKVYVGAVLVGEYFTPSSASFPLRVGDSVVVGAGEKLKFELTSGGGSKASGINVSYRLKPTVAI